MNWPTTITLRREQGFDAALSRREHRCRPKSHGGDPKPISMGSWTRRNKRLQARLDDRGSLGPSGDVELRDRRARSRPSRSSPAPFFSPGLTARAASSKRMLQATLESVREGIVALDADRRLVAWNQTFRRMLKLPKGTLHYGKTLADHKIPEIDKFEDQFEALDLQVKRTGKPALCRAQGRWEIVRDFS